MIWDTPSHIPNISNHCPPWTIIYASLGYPHDNGLTSPVLFEGGWFPMTRDLCHLCIPWGTSSRLLQIPRRAGSRSDGPLRSWRPRNPVGIHTGIHGNGRRESWGWLIFFFHGHGNSWEILWDLLGFYETYWDLLMFPWDFLAIVGISMRFLTNEKLGAFELQVEKGRCNWDYCSCCGITIP